MTAREETARRFQSWYDQLSPELRELWQQSPVDDPNVLKNMLLTQQRDGVRAAASYFNRVVQGFVPGYTPIKPLRTKGREK